MSFAVVTPCYAPDFELCRDLNRSVLRWTPPGVRHHIITPRRDRALFAPLAGDRTRLWTAGDFLPRRMIPLPGVNLWLNARRPFPPMRGWVQQQVVKLEAATRLGVDTVVLADSDVLFVRPVGIETFRLGGQLRFYRRDAEVDERLPRHLIWHAVARRLLGLPPAGPPLPDYISAFNVWDRRLVQAMRERVERVTGRPFVDAVAAELHVSEFILYGVFVDEVLGAAAPVARTDTMLCHSYWDEIPLTPAQAADFVRGRPADHVAVMISAKSRTPLAVRRAALAEPTGR